MAGIAPEAKKPNFQGSSVFFPAMPDILAVVVIEHLEFVVDLGS
jgi:hypothetical protein